MDDSTAKVNDKNIEYSIKKICLWIGSLFVWYWMIIYPIILATWGWTEDPNWNRERAIAAIIAIILSFYPPTLFFVTLYRFFSKYMTRIQAILTSICGSIILVIILIFVAEYLTP